MDLNYYLWLTHPHRCPWILPEGNPSLLPTPYHPTLPANHLASDQSPSNRSYFLDTLVIGDSDRGRMSENAGSEDTVDGARYQPVWEGGGLGMMPSFVPAVPCSHERPGPRCRIAGQGVAGG